MDPGVRNKEGLLTVIVMLVGAQIVHRTSPGVRTGCVAFALAAVVSLNYWALSGGLASFNLRGDESSWNQALAVIHNGQFVSVCTPPHPSITMAGLGKVDDVCGGLPTVVIFGSSDSISLIHDPRPGLPPALDQCVMHVTGAWWEAEPMGTEQGCSSGFTFEGGP